MGFEVERFEEDVDDFKCPICWNVLHDPIQIKKCEHMFCRLCIGKWMDQSHTCPTDRIPIKITHLRETSRFFRIQYNRLKMQCQFIYNGCDEMIQIGNIENHESICPYSGDGKNVGKKPVERRHKNLIKTLKIDGNIKSKQVETAMLAVDRVHFCQNHPYDNEAKSIGHGATISAPHMHAIILELLRSRLTKNAKVLDIGSGSGYLSVCMATMLGSGGKVIGIDHVSSLIERSKEQVKQHFSYLNGSRIQFITTDGQKGYATESPYDVINIGGAIDEVPQSIIDQLKPNGRIVVPLLYNRGQKLVTIDKLSNGQVKAKEHMKVRFGLLCDLGVQKFWSLF